MQVFSLATGGFGGFSRAVVFKVQGVPSLVLARREAEALLQRLTTSAALGQDLDEAPLMKKRSFIRHLIISTR